MRLFLLLSAAALYAPFSASAQITVSPLGVYNAGGETATEIPAYDPKTRRVFSVNGETSRVDIIDISDPNAPVLHNFFLVGGGPTSVAVRNGIVAVAVPAEPKTDPGKLKFYDTNGNFLNEVTVGALPDHVSFTPDGKYALVANEGEPNDDYTVDPEGSVSVIRMRRDVTKLTQSDVKTATFDRRVPVFERHSVRVFGPNASFAQDMEPEYIAAGDSNTAMVTLQENNAVALLHIPSARFLAVRGLGFKNHRLKKNALDASDEDGEDGGPAIHIANWPVWGMYQPDAIASFNFGFLTYYVIANEGDAREYEGTPGFVEETRIKDLILDPLAFPNAAELQEDENLGRLNVTTANGDFDNDGDYDALFSFGARSFSILNPLGNIIWDSGDDLERITAQQVPDLFNSQENDPDEFDGRSDNKGPEPEGVATGKVGHRTYAFIGLERVGGVMVYDVTLPWFPKFVQYVRSEGDAAPEGLVFIEAKDSPNGKPLLVVSHEFSGTVRIFEIN